MEIEILLYQENEKNFRKGFLDFKVQHTSEKWETFRNFAYFEKEEKKWLSPPATLRGEKWFPLYERNSSLQNIMEAALEAFKKTVDVSALATPDEGSVFDDCPF